MTPAQTKQQPQSKSEDLLNQILGGTASATATLQKKQTVFDLSKVVEEANSLVAKQDRSGDSTITQKAIEQAAAIKAANINNVRGTLQEQEISLRDITSRLSISAGAIDAQIKALKEPTAEELQQIAQAEARVAECQTAIVIAQQRNIFVRKGAVRQATDNLARAQSALARIKANVKANVQYRMEHASIDDSVSNFMTIAKRTAEVMGKGAVTMDQQAKLAQKTLVTSGEAKITLTQAMADFDQKIQNMEADIVNARETLASLIGGSPDYAKQERVVSDLENELVELRGQRNIVFIVLGEKNNDLVNFKLLQEACMNMRATYLAWKASIEAKSASNAVGWRTAIEVMRAGQSQESASDVSQASDKITQDLAASVAKYNVATQRLINDAAQRMPVVLDALFKISDAHAIRMEEQRQELEDLMAQCKANWPQIKRLNFVDNQD